MIVLKSPRIKRQFILLLVFFTAFSSVLAQSIPSSNGTANCSTCAPTGWSIVTGTPDISNRTTAAASTTLGGGTTWNGSPLPLPPNGHTNWISLRDLGPSGTEEVIGTNMTGLVPGVRYEITFYTLTARAMYSPVFNDSFRYRIGNGTIQTVNGITQDA